MRCHIQGQGFGNKMYISELFTVVGYLHTAGFKTAEELILPSVYVYTYQYQLSILLLDVNT